LRAAGRDLKTVTVQLMKDYPYGEVKSIQFLNDLVRLEQHGNDIFALQKTIQRERYARR
jgi:ATP:corrinoid adenosyltransferase